MPRLLQAELLKLKKALLELSALVEENVGRSVEAVIERDPALAREVIDLDAEIDRREVDLEEECLKVLALHQPVAVDLRFMVMLLKVNNDLERIGDLAANIAERVPTLVSHRGASPPVDICEMGAAVRRMVSLSLDALIEGDAEEAGRVREMDSMVDELNRQAYRNVEREVRGDAGKVEELLALLSVSKNLERIADHATNIAEDVVYLLEGRIVRHPGSRPVSCLEPPEF